MVTGDPVRSAAKGDHVVAGTVATDSGLRVEVTAIGDETTLAGIQHVWWRTRRRPRPGPNAWQTGPPAGCSGSPSGAAAITATVWTLIGSPDQAVVRAITVLVIACPHAPTNDSLVVSIATEHGRPRAAS